MKELKQSDYPKLLKNKVCAILFTNPTPCSRCDEVKALMPKVEQKLPNIPIVYFSAAADVYPVNELSKELSFKTVPTFVIFKDGKPVSVIKSVQTPKTYIQALQNQF
ncbi:hypothetical protein FORMB_16690 [Formosa sp. Hel1_33_131]|uniref:thioredoxin family protein n=1 Tax=Formosa sp. Hel1_33_131 TaxID=1336794 RepID=UPI00084E1939|nr:thioredoxin family protein [Formosa sp. Hel1_33_131]AOR28708.1 hypothetical protein FORMB_16690 [Formosa sp. Hel1_33_131]